MHKDFVFTKKDFKYKQRKLFKFYSFKRKNLAQTFFFIQKKNNK